MPLTYKLEALISKHLVLVWTVFETETFFNFRKYKLFASKLQVKNHVNNMRILFSNKLHQIQKAQRQTIVELLRSTNRLFLRLFFLGFVKKLAIYQVFTLQQNYWVQSYFVL